MWLVALTHCRTWHVGSPGDATHQHPWETGLESLLAYTDLLPPCSAEQRAQLPDIPSSVSARAMFPGTAVMDKALCLATCLRDHGYNVNDTQYVVWQRQWRTAWAVALTQPRRGRFCNVVFAGVRFAWSRCCSTPCTTRRTVTW